MTMANEEVPPYKPQGKVSDKDPCQPVYRVKEGGYLIHCKGKNCSANVKCSGLQKRRKKGPGPWHNAEDDGTEVYDKNFEYRCCKGHTEHEGHEKD
jgi:hypothetical protein